LRGGSRQWRNPTAAGVCFQVLAQLVTLPALSMVSTTSLSFSAVVMLPPPTPCRRRRSPKGKTAAGFG
jgi:hypothetical protein